MVLHNHCHPLLTPEFFRQALDDLLMHSIEQTNLYIRQKRAASGKWEDMTVSELKAFFEVWIFMTIIMKPAMRNYWAKGLIEREFPIVTETLPQNRILAIYGISF